MVIPIGSFFLIKHMKTLLLEKISKNTMIKMMRRLYRYMKKRLKKIDRDPKVYFNENKYNADDMLGKTGYYNPKTEEIHLFITDRHPKDILRSFAHEVIHHEQNCSGYTATVDMSITTQPDYASKDKGLRKAEKDAFTRGNIIFRDWTDKLKKKRSEGERIMSEQKNKKKKKKLNAVEKAKQLAAKDAAEQYRHITGADVKDLKDDPDYSNTPKNKKNKNLKESKNNDSTIHPELFEQKERLLKDAFQKRENKIFEELMKQWTKNNGNK